MPYWLVKQEPEIYSWDDFEKEGRTEWTGVRNAQARNNLQQMQVGDKVLYYHSGKEKAVVGVAKVTAAAYPDPTTPDKRWVAVELATEVKFKQPISLKAIKEEELFKNMVLVKQGRLSVSPVTAEEFRRLLELGQTRLKQPA